MDTIHTCDSCRSKGYDMGDDFTPADSWCGNKTRKNRILPEKGACKYWKCRVRDPIQVGMTLNYFGFNWSNARKAKDPAAVIARALVKDGWYKDVAQASAENYITVCKSLEIWKKGDDK